MFKIILKLNCSFFKSYRLCTINAETNFFMFCQYILLLKHCKQLFQKYFLFLFFVFILFILCSGYHHCTTSFNKAWTQVLRRFKSCSRRVGDSRWWGSLTVVLAGNKAKRLSSVNHITKLIHHHHHQSHWYTHNAIYHHELYATNPSSFQIFIWNLN